MARRTENERIALLETIARRIAAEPGLRQPWSIDIRLKQGETIDQQVIEPDRVAIRSLLMEVRKLDVPRGDVYLPKIIDIVAGRASDPHSKAGLARARAYYDELQTRGAIRLDVGEHRISARQAFELWAYSEHLHDDPEKEQRMREMNDLARPHVGLMAGIYMNMLANLALYVREVIRGDPGVAASLKPSS
jgi:hypothetical protein